jgi:hypothetical protein
MNKSLKTTLIALTPLVVFLNLLPWVRDINVKLLLSVDFAIVALVPWMYRKDLIEWSAARVKEDHERRRRTHRLRLAIGTISFLGLSVFFLVSYLLDLLKE